METTTFDGIVDKCSRMEIDQSLVFELDHDPLPEEAKKLMYDINNVANKGVCFLVNRSGRKISVRCYKEKGG